MKPNLVTVCFSSVAFGKIAPDSIIYIPKGEQTVTGSRGGKPFELSITSDETLAGILNAQLKQAQLDAAAGLASKPFIDFNHEGGRASALPTEFFWDAERGVCLSLEWTPAGRQAIEGEEFAYFSPELAIDKNGRPTGIRCPGPIGGLVNTPAFQTIGTIAASLNQQPTNMNQLLELLKKYGMELPDDSEMEAVCSALEPKLAAYMQAKSDLATAKASLKTFEDAAAATAKAALEAEADATVKLALKDGKITDAAPWKTAYLASPDTVKAQLASLPAKPDGHAAPVKLGTPGAVNATFGQKVSAEEFQAMTPTQKMEFSKNGGRII